MKKYCLLALMVSSWIFPLLASSANQDSPPPQYQQEDFLCEVIAHLYRWHLDEIDVAAATQSANKKLWVREVSPELDPGDRSQFAEVLLPAVGVKAVLKKTDYTIKELDMVVKSDGYKIVRVSRVDSDTAKDPSWHLLELDRVHLRKVLFQKRGEISFPEGEMIKRMQHAVRSQVREHLNQKGIPLPVKADAVHFSSLSPVANECWVFWETGRVLIHFASDLDLSNPSVWEHDELSGTLYDLDEQVVVSLQEVLGSNAFLTRDQVGRAIYNCVVLGRRVVLEPSEAENRMK
jgi:hypothetical protein